VCEQTSSKTEASLQTAFRLLLLRKRNQFLRLFLCEREIIVNALFLLKCLGNGQNQIQVQRYKYYLKIDNILWKRTKKKQTFTNKEVLYSKFCNKFNNKI